MIVPEMIGSIVGVYNGKTFNQVEIKVMIKKILDGGFKPKCKLVKDDKHMS